MKKKVIVPSIFPTPPPLYSKAQTQPSFTRLPMGGGGRRVDPRYNCLHLCPTTSEASDAHIVTIPVDEVDPHSQG